jgi:hypothetical protein
MAQKFQIEDKSTGKKAIVEYDGAAPTDAEMQSLIAQAFPQPAPTATVSAHAATQGHEIRAGTARSIVAAPASPHQDAAQLIAQRLATMQANLTAPPGQPGENPPDTNNWQNNTADALKAIEGVVAPAAKTAKDVGKAWALAELSMRSATLGNNGQLQSAPLPPSANNTAEFAGNAVSGIPKLGGGVVSAITAGVGMTSDAFSSGLHAIAGNADRFYADTYGQTHPDAQQQLLASEAQHNAAGQQQTDDAQQIGRSLVQGIKGGQHGGPAQTLEAFKYLGQGDFQKANEAATSVATMAGHHFLENPIDALAILAGGAGIAEATAGRLAAGADILSTQLLKSAAEATLKGDTKVAEAALSQAQKFQAASATLRSGARVAGRIASPLGNHMEADAKSRALTLDNQAEALHRRADLQAKQGDFHGAQQSLEQASQAQYEAYNLRTKAGVISPNTGTAPPPRMGPIRPGEDPVLPRPAMGDPIMTGQPNSPRIAAPIFTSTAAAEERAPSVQPPAEVTPPEAAGVTAIKPAEEPITPKPADEPSAPALRPAEKPAIAAPKPAEEAPVAGEVLPQEKAPPPLASPIRLTSAKNAPTLQKLPEGEFEPAASKAFTATTKVNGNEKHTQTNILIGKEDPNAAGGILPTHVVIAGNRSAAGAAPKASDPVWTVYPVDPNAARVIPSTSVGVGEHIATGLTRKAAIAMAKDLSGKPAAAAELVGAPAGASVPAGSFGTTERDLASPAKPNAVTPMARIEPAPIAGGDPKRLSQIILDLGKAVGNKVRLAKTGRGVAGTYTPGTASLKIKFAGDLDTTAHEIAHALDDLHGIVSDWAKPRMRSPFDTELEKFWHHGSVSNSGPRSTLAYKRAEGVAEWMRAYIVNPDAAIAAAPKFYEHVMTKIPSETLEAIHSFSNDVRQFAGLPASEKIGANVALTANAKPLTQRLQQALKGEGWDFETTALDKLQAAVQDALKPFVKAVEYARQIQGGTLLPEYDPILLARVHSGVVGKVLDIFDNGMINARNERVTPGGLKWLMEPFDQSSKAALEKDLSSTVAYMIGQRQIEKAGQIMAEARAVGAPGSPENLNAIAGAQMRVQRLTGVGGGMYSDLDVARAAIKEIEANPALAARVQEGAARYRQWADSLLDYQVQKGRMSQASVDAIRANNEHYVALQREMETIKPQGKGGGKLGSVGNIVNRFKGSTREIQNPYRILQDQTHAMIAEADRNAVMRSFRDLLVGKRGMYQGPPDNLAAIGRRAKVGDANTIKIIVDGKAEYWQFENGVHQALKGLGEAGIPDWMKPLAAIAGAGRGAITHAPGFLIRNVFRDAIERTLLSKHGGRPWDAAAKLNADDMEAFRLAGGDQAGHYMRSKEGYGKTLEAAIREMTADKSVKNIISTGGDFLKRYEDLAKSSELLNRMAEYKAAYKHATETLGYDEYNAQLYAAKSSRDLMDFAISGTWGKQINSVVPFTNAAVQGGANMLRLARTNPRAFLAKWGLYCVVPEMAVYAWNVAQGKDTLDEWRQLPAYQRDMFWNLKAGPDTWIRIPKGFELGVLASGVSRTLDLANGNKSAFEGYSGSAAKAFMPYDEQSLIGPFKPLVEDMANYDFFRGKSIIPSYEANLELSRRKGTEEAPRMSQALGKVFQSDPRKVDHFLRAQFGDVAKLGGSISDIGRPDRPAAGLNVLYSAAGLMTSSPAASAPDVQRVMDIAKSLGKPNPLKDQIAAYYGAATPTQRDQAARELRQAAKDLRPQYEQMQDDPPSPSGGAGRPHGPRRPSSHPPRR